MKTSVKLIASLFAITALIMCNLHFVIDKELTNIFYGNIEALAADESGSNIGNKYQIQAGCNGKSFYHFKKHCCRGSYPTCVEECPNGIIYSGCSTHGRLPLN